MISKLRTEHTNLNDYQYYLNYHFDGNCKFCDTPETVEHFIMECPGITDQLTLSLSRKNVNYNVCRNRLRKKVRGIACFFKNPANFTIINLLFPHIWQLKPYRDDMDYNRKLENNVWKRAQILKHVCQFVRETKRFVDEPYGI